jgi:deoxyhypusine synthase
METLETTETKVKTLSSGLQAMIVKGERDYVPAPETPVSNWIVATKLHCNGGRTVDAGLWLKHCADEGKLFVTLSGAASSFQVGRTLSMLIRAGHVGAISATGANMEESCYRYVANRHYASIPDYTDLTREQEKELDRAGLRRITDTFLPEDESVRVVLPHLMGLWSEAAETGAPGHWHEFFFQLFARNLIAPDPTANPADCWLYQAWKHRVPVFVPGWEDSTMGNVFTHATYAGSHAFLKKYALDRPIPFGAVRHSFEYMHTLAEWYMDTTSSKKLAFLQLGGGIAADFPICVVPHLKKDYLADRPLAEQEALIPTWAAFVEIHLTPMSAGSYSGAGYKEKITWSKFEPDAYGVQIFGDFTSIFPDIAALILGR